MEVGGDDKEHYCRVCGKCFPCGRSLGGHMRSHLSLIPSSSEVAKKMTMRGCSSHGGCSISASTSARAFMELRACYALRRKPKLSCRPPEPAVPRRAATKRRSRRVASIATSTSSSSAASEFDEEEDVAICLMMLSRDSLLLSKKRHSLASKQQHEVVAGVDAKGSEELHLLQARSEEKRARFECPECNKPFRSYQALGGHRANRKRINGGCCSSKIHFPDDTSFESPKKARDTAHQCPICDKVFGSGQALGGHKRSHLMGRRMPVGSVDGETFAAGSKPSTMHELLDLNLPAAAAEDENANAEDAREHEPWWIERDHKHESSVGFI